MSTQTMMSLGKIKFKGNDKYLTKISRMTSANYAELKKLNHSSTLQFVGNNSDHLNLTGELIADGRNAENNLNDLRELLKAGEPQLLIGYEQQIIGEFVILKVTENSDQLSANGIKKISFNVELKKYEK